MSKQCRKCGVYVEDGIHNCPLCGAFITEENNNSTREFPKLKIKTAKQIFLKIIAFLSIFVCALVLAINLAVSKKMSWSLHVIFPIALLWITVGRCTIKRYSVRQHLAWDFAGLIALFFYIEHFAGSTYHWAFDLAMPITVIVWATILEILYFAHKSAKDNYQVALTRLFLISAICIGISFLWLKTCNWGWYVCTARGLVDVLAMAIFDKESYSIALKKRLHV